MTNQYALAGAQQNKASRFAPIWTNRFCTGLVTQRSPLRTNSPGVYEKFGYAGQDALIAGSNVEISNRLTPIRRPGCSLYNSASFSNAVDFFYDFRLFNTTSEQIKVMVDTTSAFYEGTGPSNQNLVFTKSAGAGQTIPLGVGNTLFFGNGVDQKKWVQTLTTWSANTAYVLNPSAGQIQTFFIDPNGNIQQLTACILTISSVTVTAGGTTGFANTCTVTVTSDQVLTKVLSIGLQPIFSGLSAGNNTWLNALTGTSVPTITVVASGTFSFGTNHATYGATSDTGLGTILAGGNPYSGTSAPAWNTNLLGTTNDTTGGGTAQWTNRGTPLENWGIAAPTTAPTVNTGASVSAWQANTYYGNSSVVFPVTNVAITSNVLTITTSATLTNRLAVGSTVSFQNVGVATFLNGQTVSVLSVSLHSFTANFTNANYTAADSGSFSFFTACIIDSNGNIQQVKTGGTSGGTTPAWASSVGATTTDGSVTWVCIQLAPLAWAAHTAYASGQFITATANGTNCLFQGSNPVSAVQISGAVTAYFWPSVPNSFGSFAQVHPLSTGSASATATGNSLMFNPPALTGSPDPNIKPMQWATFNASGEITGYTTPWSGATEGYDMVVTCNLVIPAPGNYTFQINHDDGMYWGIGSGSATGSSPSKISGPSNNPFGQSVTAVNGYALMGANNVQGNNNDTYVVSFTAADTYPIEIDFSQYLNEQQLVVNVNGNSPVTGPIQSQATAPVWPAWTTAGAPAYPTVTESRGQLQWTNIGPVTDHQWHSVTKFQNTQTIIDSNGNIEAPFEAGVSGTTSAPKWATGINQLTKDNPNLVWINQGAGTAPAGGSLSTFNGGWIYYPALVNTLTNTVSNAGIASVSTGNFVGSSGVTITGGLPTVIDPQTDYVAIFRTKDGGTAPFLINGLYNSIYTVPLSTYQASGYTDTSPDANLNIEESPALNGENTPPGVGATNLAFHLNRIFFSIGNTVYWTDGPDAPIGNGLEGVQGINNAVFPSLVKRIVPTAQGAFVYTVSDIYIISGNGTATSPLFPLPWAPGIGLLSYNALDVNGTTMGLFTTDQQFIVLDPSSGVSEHGFPIGDQLDGTGTWSGPGAKALFNPSNVYVTWHVSGSQDKAWYVTDGATGWFRLNPTAAPESGMMWSTFATITGGCRAVQSIEVSPGVHNLLIGPATSGQILKRDISTNADNGTSYLANFVMGSIVLAQPGQIAETAFITTDSKAVGTRPTLGILMDEISGVFDPISRWENDPPKLVASSSTYAQRFYLMEGENPALCRHLQIQVNWPAENTPSELYSLTIFGGFSAEN